MHVPVTSEQDGESFVDENTTQKTPQVLSKQISQQSLRKMVKSDVVKDRVNIKKMNLEEL